VHFGEQTTDEMCFCWIQFVADRREDYIDVIKGSWQTIFVPRWQSLLGGNKPASDGSKAASDGSKPASVDAKPAK
jgi:imidazole glycerol phosphate synthase subunit HisF